MNTTSRSSLFLAFCVSASAVLAQAVAPGQSEAAAESSARTKKDRAISGETSSLLSAGYKYNPQKPVEKTVDEDELVDQRDVDKPRNAIIRLPKYMVEAERPPVFNDRDFYTTKGALTQRMLRSYFGNNLVNQRQLGKAGQMYAAQSFWDEERMKGMMEVDRQVSIYRVAGDEERAEKAAQESQSTYIRVNDAQSAELSKQAGQRY